ncbi:GNAT family N-acetyltransferase [Mobilicoccus massiliensis]|uniref:GNAT family N-acetyltransferase n=1 Tax=Mobilicoccus massiliensis TaxID=1522310 RepID=UPI000591309B|nr:GNAT family protein [Mobilicoccus massiliensis]
MSNDSPIWTPARHPLARFLRELATGTRPTADGGWMRVTPWVPHVQAILSFPGHSILAVSYDWTENQLSELGVDGYDGAHDPRVVTTLAKDGWIDTLDMLFLGSGRGEQPGEPRLVARPDLARHDFVEYTHRGHTEVQVFGSPDPDSEDLVVLSRGVGGLREICVRLAAEHRGRGRGTELVEAALRSVPEDELVVACVAPYNVPAIRSLERAGMSHHGTIQLFTDRPERRV